jgi:deoxyribonuclease V
MTDRQPLHVWDLDPQAAARIQSELRAQLSLAWDDRAIYSVGGVDLSYHEDIGRAAVVVFSFPDLKPLTSVVVDVPVRFPYIPGLLAFREGPVFLAAWEKLETRPDVVMFDGQGIAHPRGLGIAAHMGLWIERPTIGVAKSRLYGSHAELPPQAGAVAELHDPRHQNAVIGAALRTKERTNPLYVSPGHLMDVPTAVDLVFKCSAGYRLPEPTRWAHRVAGGEKLPGADQEAGPHQISLF